MANLVVADVCNLKCPYCFAQDHMRARRAASAPAFISLEAFEARLDFLNRSGIHEIRLIGGEPTLHPRFPELVERARRRGKHIAVFSHGLLSEKALVCLEALSPDECTVLVNMNASRFPNGPDELYDLRTDSGERVNLVDRAEHAHTQKELAARLEAFFTRYADPKYDLWRGGRSKTLLLTSKQRTLR